MNVLKPQIIFFVLFVFCTGVTQGQDKPELKFGGALQFNYNFSSWEAGQKVRGGDFGYEMFSLTTKAAYKGVKFNAEYRLYSENFGGGMLRQGWARYDFNEKVNMQLGLAKVPFGISQFNSNNWFSNITYYLGLEDDYDMGIKYSYTSEKWEYALAYFKNAEDLFLESYSDVSDNRYSYDISSIDLNEDGSLDLRNKETNQLNGRLIFKMGVGRLIQQIGISGQYGGLYNITTEKTGNHYAMAGHYEMQVGRMVVKAQIANYGHNPQYPEGEPDGLVAMTAYGAPYLVASDASIYTLCFSYSVDVDWKPVSNLQFYNDYGYMNKRATAFEDSYMNVTGVLVTMGNLLTYIDAAAGKNHPWFGPEWADALGSGTKNAKWNLRFNINLGYYF